MLGLVVLSCPEHSGKGLYPTCFFCLALSCPGNCRQITFEVNLLISGCHLHGIPRDVIHYASIAAQKYGPIWLLSAGPCGLLCLHSFHLGNVVPSVFLYERKSGPIASSMPQLNAGNMVPLAHLHLPRVSSSLRFLIARWKTSSPQDNSPIPWTYNHRHMPRE